MKYLITVAALLVCSPALAAPTALHRCDVNIWETKEVASLCAQRAGNAAAIAAGQFRREVARAYRADPIGARIIAAKSVRPVQPKRLAVATVFSPQFMASLKKKP